MVKDNFVGNRVGFQSDRIGKVNDEVILATYDGLSTKMVATNTYAADISSLTTPAAFFITSWKGTNSGTITQIYMTDKTLNEVNEIYESGGNMYDVIATLATPDEFVKDQIEDVLYRNSTIDEDVNFFSRNGSIMSTVSNFILNGEGAELIVSDVLLKSSRIGISANNLTIIEKNGVFLLDNKKNLFKYSSLG